MSFPQEFLKYLRCPVCSGKLIKEEKNFICQDEDCQKTFPLINGIPILINEDKSVFSIKDFVDQKETTLNLTKSKIQSVVRKIVPSISNNIKARANYKRLLSLFENRSVNSKVLVIGGSILGKGIEEILNAPNITFLESDVSFGPRTQIIFDAHNIPFEDSTFDGVIIQAVLEHVVDPYRCVKEITRILKKEGLVYAETPFMQQVHMGKYDFHRFTHLGHRRLFREFSEIDSGAVCGPGMSLAWAYSHFIFSFFRSKELRRLLIPFTNLTSFFWKYFDYLVIDKPGSFDAASGYYFMGKKSDYPLDDRELLKLYKGLL
jgi:SAM-dependent methyltransferase